MKKLAFLIKIFFFLLIISTNNLYSKIDNKIIANVGDQIISSYELKNKIKTLLFLSKQELNQKNINDTKNTALRNLIDSKLKLLEVKKFKISLDVNKGYVDYLNKISSKFNTNINGLKKKFLDNNLDYDLYLNEIKTEFAWQNLIFSFYAKKINIEDKEIDKELKLITDNQKNSEEYHLAEIQLINESAINKNTIMQIKEQIKVLGFNNAAIKYSNAPSALDGGDIGWFNSKSLSNKISKIVTTMETGEISEPILLTNTLMFIKVLDKRKLDFKNMDIKLERKKLILSKKNDLLNLFSNSHLSKKKNSTLINIK
jgi:peptidyl-prolyl cis-trans isomerase SurA